MSEDRQGQIDVAVDFRKRRDILSVHFGAAVELLGIVINEDHCYKYGQYEERSKSQKDEQKDPARVADMRFFEEVLLNLIVIQYRLTWKSGRKDVRRERG